MLPEYNKDKKIEIDRDDPKVNQYFMVISGRFKVAKYIVTAFLVVFLLLMVTLFRSEITLENLRYLVKDFEFKQSVISSNTNIINYDADSNVRVSFYKGDLAVAGSSYFFLCDLNGKKGVSDEGIFSNPILVSSEKYLIVYGLSEYTYSVYNSFSKLYTESFSYPIVAAAAANNGMYAIATRTAEYRTAIYLYNNDFERIGAIYKDKYIMDLRFNDDGTELLVVSAYSSDGEYCSEIMTYIPYSDKPGFSETVTDALPILAGYNKNDGFSVIFDDRILFYDSEGILRNNYSFGTKVPLAADISSDHLAVIFSKNIVGNDIELYVFDNNGDLFNKVSFEGNPRKIKSTENSIYLLLVDQICKIDIKSGEITYKEIDKNSLDLVVVDEDVVFVCYSDKTIKADLKGE